MNLAVALRSQLAQPRNPGICHLATAPCTSNCNTDPESGLKETAAKHERIVKEASRLFRERGFEKVSVDEVMKAAGLTHGAFYAHFGSKGELQAAAVAYGQKGSLGRVQRSNGKETTGPYAADRYLSRWHRDNPGDGCTWAALAQEVARSTPELKAAFEHGFEEIISASGGDRKGRDIPPNREVRRRACLPMEEALHRGRENALHSKTMAV